MVIPVRKIRIQRQKAVKQLRRNRIKIILILAILVLITIGAYATRTPVIISPVVEQEIISPVPEAGESGKLDIEPPTPTASPSATHGAVNTFIEKVEAKEPEPITANEVSGEASYYSRAGCLGCSENLTMANGETLDDSKATVALTPELVAQHKLLNDIVIVENLATGEKVEAKVTDTGGFGKYNRVADLSVATKEAINCNSLCNVKVSF